jgi:hypothetical protein
VFDRIGVIMISNYGTRQWLDGWMRGALGPMSALFLATACSASGGDAARNSATGGSGGTAGSVNWGSGGSAGAGAATASGGTGNPGSGGTGAGGDAGTTGSGGGVGGTGGAPPSTPLTLSIGPVSMAPGQELTVCVDVRMPTSQPFELVQVNSDMTEGGHHLIVYTSSAQSEALTPYACSAAADIVDPNIVPLFIAQQAQTELVFPPGVAFQLAAQRMLKLELHFLNTHETASQATATVNFYGADPRTIVNHSNFMFWGPTALLIPPNTPATTPAVASVFYPFNKATPPSIFGLTTHTHKQGQRTMVHMGPDGSQNLVYQNTNWEEPPLQIYNPPLRPASASEGLRLTCEYNNPTSNFITFGEGAELNEMCFLWAYYYPDQGADVRVVLP